MKWRKLPVDVDAFRLGTDDMPDWFMNKVSSGDAILRGEYPYVFGIDIHTDAGWIWAVPGDYVIKDVKGEINPCKPDVFHMTHAPV